jgi:O-antigen/teichoic acid export membrane protein
MMAILMFPAVLIGTAFAPDGLRLWVGQEVASHGARVAQWLALGVLVNSLAQVPFTLLHAEGRPDLTAKLHVIELPAYGALLWYLTIRMGVDGVAIAWTLRVAADAIALFALVAVRSNAARRRLVPAFRIAIPLLAAASAPMLFHSLAARSSVAALMLLIAAPFVLRFGLDDVDRARLGQLLRRPLFRQSAAT